MKSTLLIVLTHKCRTGFLAAADEWCNKEDVEDETYPVAPPSEIGQVKLSLATTSRRHNIVTLTVL